MVGNTNNGVCKGGGGTSSSCGSILGEGDFGISLRPIFMKISVLVANA